MVIFVFIPVEGGVTGPSDRDLGPVTPLTTGGGYQGDEQMGVTWNGAGFVRDCLDLWLQILYTAHLI